MWYLLVYLGVIMDNIEISKSELLQLCHSLIDGSQHYDNSNSLNYGGLYYCAHCGKYEEYDKDRGCYVEKHEGNCIINLANELVEKHG